MRFSADGVTRGIMTVSYDRDEYRPTIRNGGQPVFVGIAIHPLTGPDGAVHASNDLAIEWVKHRFDNPLNKEFVR